MCIQLSQTADARRFNEANALVPISPTHEAFGDAPADAALMLQNQGSIAACQAACCCGLTDRGMIAA